MVNPDMSAEIRWLWVVQRLRQVVAFAAVGLLATAIQYAILMTGVELFGQSPTFSSGVGFSVSAVVNYLLNYRFTFRSTGAHATTALRFILVSSVGLLLNVVTMHLLTVVAHVQYVLAQVIATGLVFAWTFCGSAFWTFTGGAARDP